MPDASSEEAENADLRTKLEAASEAEERMNDAFAGCRERLSQEIRQREAAEGEAERIMAANDVPEMYGAGQRRAAERILLILSEPANAEGIASEGGSVKAPRRQRATGPSRRVDRQADAPSAEAGQPTNAIVVDSASVEQERPPPTGGGAECICHRSRFAAEWCLFPGHPGWEARQPDWQVIAGELAEYGWEIAQELNGAPGIDPMRARLLEKWGAALARYHEAIAQHSGEER